MSTTTVASENQVPRAWHHPEKHVGFSMLSQWWQVKSLPPAWGWENQGTGKFRHSPKRSEKSEMEDEDLDERDHGVGEGCMSQKWGSWWGLEVTAEYQWPFPRPLQWLFLLLQWSSQGHLTSPLSSDNFLTTCCMSGTLLSPGHTWRQVHTGEKEPPGGGMKKTWLEGCSMRFLGRQLVSQAFSSQHFGDVQSLIYLWPVSPLGEGNGNPL